MGEHVRDPGRIVLRGVRQHNLRIGELSLPRGGLTVLTGVSGSGKSSLAFDTIYAEGHRQYLDSLSAHVRRRLPKVARPTVDWVSGLSPTVAIEQRTISRNPRSNVGTITEISDRLRLLFARAGRHDCRKCGTGVAPLDTAAHLAALAEAAAEEPVRLVATEPDGGETEVLRLAATPDADTLADAGLLVERELRAERRLTVLRDRTPVRHLAAGWVCPHCGTEVHATSSDWFTPNSPAGMCDHCQGLGFTYRVDTARLVGDARESVRSGALTFYGDRRRGKKTWWPQRDLPDLLAEAGAGLDTPWEDLPAAAADRILGDLTEHIERLFKDADSPERKAFYQGFMAQRQCGSCGGTRHCAEALAVRLAGRNIAEVNGLAISRLRDWVGEVRAELAGNYLAALSAELLDQVDARVEFLLEVGLHYLSLDRAAPTLSAGEGQRLRLARQLGSGLVGVVYVLDEPSIGLHARDNGRLIGMLRRLADAGNTVLVVEHDRETMEAADHLVDMGPGAGTRGGLVVASGPTAEVVAHGTSATSAYLRNERAVVSPRPERRRPDDRRLELTGARLNNLRGVDLTIPIGVLTCVTGVSGSGKSSLITRTLQPAVDAAVRWRRTPVGPFDRLRGAEHVRRVTTVTQDSIGGSSRSTPATYLGVFDEIRKLFAGTDEAVRRGYSTAMFSFNTEAGGRCDRCAGKGAVRIEMLFLADVSVRCPSCDGLRYSARVLEITHRGRTIAETLALEVGEAIELYADAPAISGPLRTLSQVGLGYLRLGQDTGTLSGGEAQRLKLARELLRRDEGGTLYLIDEPTTGLHFSDVQVLLDVLHDLVDRDNTVVVIEHSVEFAAASDWLVDLGPGGGEDGGRLVAAGPPELLATHPDSAIAPYLARQLALTAARRPAPETPGRR
ncbi:excinuclease ABC subunit UvrA [Micromonospora sp. WMMD712]|uniref:excinuclease ABC subunit UvrA n=1 Tax=Micromonospora TaxID=1873 RepID=UPI00249A1379|nr:excinuclease ABC subunit UvrA [Micromonospora sp. WMMD712]WFE59450.1 excinuclease ABC subunit UvrA [Micromonospora sp. WMMD712]